MKRNRGSIGPKFIVLPEATGGVFELHEVYKHAVASEWPITPVLLSTPSYPSSVSEGGIFTLTVNVAFTSLLFYDVETVSGNVVAADFWPASLSGSFAVTNNSGTLSLSILGGDGIENDIFKINIRYSSTSGPILFTTGNIPIIDVSSLNPFETNTFNGLCSYLSNYMTEYKNTSFFEYSLDGTSIYINDGGNDMYDGGNFTYPVYIGLSPNYSTSSSGSNLGGLALAYNTVTPTTVDGSFVYRALGYTRPLTILGYRSVSNTVVGFQKSGNSGADGGGTLSSGFIYNGALVNGFTVWAFHRETYNASDPSHCDVYILLGHSAWGSVYGTVTTYADPVSNGGNGGLCHMQNCTNVLSIVTLLSKSSGVLVTTTDIQAVVDAYINRIRLYCYL